MKLRPLRPLYLVCCLLMSASATATPLNWVFTGTASEQADFDLPSNYNGMPIAAGTPFTLTVFVNTDVVGVHPPGLSDILFSGPFQAEVQIGSLGTLPLNSFDDVQYFAENGAVAGVQFDQGARTFANFSPSIPTDILHLTAFGPVSLNGNQFVNSLFGPNLALGVSGYTIFAAITPVAAAADGGTTVYLFASGLLLLLSLRGYSLRERQLNELHNKSRCDIGAKPIDANRTLIP
jgi:hypothetical protein